MTGGSIDRYIRRTVRSLFVRRAVDVLPDHALVVGDSDPDDMLVTLAASLAVEQERRDRQRDLLRALDVFTSSPR